MCELNAGAARLVLAAEMGGGIARLDLGDRHVLRPWSGNEDSPFSLASNVLVPFSNRISGGGFSWNGVHYPLVSNLEGDPFPIHGDGFQKAWRAEQGGDTARLVLTDGAIGPWRYRAEQVFQLFESGLDATLTMTNTAEKALPFGGGFHPWFPRNDQTRLSFEARGVWMEDSQHLPVGHLMLADAPDWDFDQPRTLPSGPINNGYTDWSGQARIEQGVDAVSCRVTASENLGTAIVYSPGESADFFCFEPVSHPVDAFHQPSHPGLKELAPGQSLTAKMTLSWRLA